MISDQEEDQDSLFGSPPPSPTRGRSPSPALALPSRKNSGDGAVSSSQNVGTIALPGSHLSSELPPLALSLSNDPPPPHAHMGYGYGYGYGYAPRPPAPQHNNTNTNRFQFQTQTQSQAQTQPYIPTQYNYNIPTTTTYNANNTHPRGTSVAPPKKKAKTSKSKSSTPRPAPPPIPLPDPSAPVPAHFLRNQSALLGHAGLVGGVNPAHLSVPRHTRGSTSQNPIIVEDEHNPPPLGLKKTYYHTTNNNPLSPYHHYPTIDIDPALLPAPTNEEIVATLIRQKNIFPVLESILKLIASGAQQNSSPDSNVSTGWATSHNFKYSSNSNSQQRASSVSSTTSSDALPPTTTTSATTTKKRKLARVPAGAVDWDVPYPFPNGQGPEEYSTTWEKERGKQLIAQLVGLIKSAARKAATKSYLQQEQVKKYLQANQLVPPPLPRKKGSDKDRQKSSSPVVQRITAHYRPNTLTYGLNGDEASTMLAQVNASSIGDTADAMGTGVGEVLTDASNGKDLSSMTSTSSHDPYLSGQQNTPFDQLIASLLNATPDQGGAGGLLGAGASGSSHSFIAGTEGDGDGQASSSTDMTQSDYDQGLFDNWMSILHTFPIPEEGFEQQQHNQEPPSAPDYSNFEIPGFTDLQFPDDDGGDASMFDFVGQNLEDVIMNDNGSGGGASGSIDNLGSDLVGSEQAPTPVVHDAPQNSSSNDCPIDPALLAISIPPRATPGSGTGTGGSGTPSFMPSPSPLTSVDPLTPNSSNWELGGSVEVFSGANSNFGGERESGVDGGSYSTGSIVCSEPPKQLAESGTGSQGMWRRAIRNSVLKAQRAVIKEGSAETGSGTVNKGKGKATEISPVPQPTPTYAANFGLPGPATMGYVPTVTIAHTLRNATTARTSKSLIRDKEDILRRAREQRRQLAAEIERAKVELWETTIEQGVLTHLIKEV